MKRQCMDEAGLQKGECSREEAEYNIGDEKKWRDTADMVKYM